MKKIEIKNRFTGDIMFTIISENATIKDALLDAIKNKVNLSRANLSRAYLSGADLSGADLSGADLSGADFQPFCKWRTSIKDNEITIGCKTKSIDDWDIFFNSDLLYETKRNTEEFKKIQAVFESYKTYINFLNK